MYLSRLICNYQAFFTGKHCDNVPFVMASLMELIWTQQGRPTERRDVCGADRWHKCCLLEESIVPWNLSFSTRVCIYEIQTNRKTRGASTAHRERTLLSRANSSIHPLLVSEIFLFLRLWNTLIQHAASFSWSLALWSSERAEQLIFIMKRSLVVLAIYSVLSCWLRKCASSMATICAIKKPLVCLT